mmetsp:Transcript_26198/g.86170  ORF Transcript_26198/g.86170 Transcript_26198/m.86170 type:complete len:262 (+) Transcript_26198:249-1034(+)
MRMLSPPHQLRKEACDVPGKPSALHRKRERETATLSLSVENQENKLPNIGSASSRIQTNSISHQEQQGKKQRTSVQELVLTETFITESDMMKILNQRRTSSKKGFDDIASMFESFTTQCKFAVEMISNDFMKNEVSENVQNEKINSNTHSKSKIRSPSLRSMSSTNNGSIVIRKVLHADGDRYFGTCLDLQMHGLGSVWYANGDRYIGQLKKNLRHGYGKMVWSDGHIYEGLWKEDLVISPFLTSSYVLTSVADLSRRSTK